MIWLTFVASAAIIVAAATKLADYGDVIAIRTRLGGMFVGTLLLALATSLPELLTMISAIGQDLPGLAVGNIFGSCMFNMFLLGVLDTATRRVRLLRQVALSHAVSGSLAVLMIAATIFFVMAELDWRIGWLGWDSVVLMGLYVAGVRLMRSRGPSDDTPTGEEADRAGVATLRRGLIGFGAATLVLVVATPVMVDSSADIAVLLGVSDGFIGAFAVAIVTSLPEAVTTAAAIRINAFDMAVGNLFGSNIFNIFALALTDVFYLDGRFLGAVDETMLLAGMLGLVLTALGLLGNVARLERRFLAVEIDALTLMVVYLAGIALLYSRGAMPV